MNIQNLNTKNYEINNTLKILRERGSELSEDHLDQYIKITFNHLSVVEQILFDKQKQRHQLKKDFEFYRQRVRTHKMYQKFINHNNIHIDGRDIIYITNDLRTVMSLDKSIIIELKDYSEDNNSGNLVIDKEIIEKKDGSFKYILLEGIRTEFKQINNTVQLNANNSAKFNGMTNSIVFNIDKEDLQKIQINCINSWGMPVFKSSTRISKGSIND